MTKDRTETGGTAIALLAGICVFLGTIAPATAADTAWAALRLGGHLALMRHALAPGAGDPPDFVLEDCATQRNLSQEGRDQAARIGAEARANGITAARVLSSQWCRCLETANLLGLGPVEPMPALNSSFRHPENAIDQTLAVEAWIASQEIAQPLFLVTHQANITALTGVYPRSGEILIVAPEADGGLVLIERLLIK